MSLLIDYDRLITVMIAMISIRSNTGKSQALHGGIYRPYCSNSKDNSVAELTSAKYPLNVGE